MLMPSFAHDRPGPGATLRSRIRCAVQHHLNPLHVECRLVGLARGVCRFYERRVYNKLLAGKGR